MERTLSREQASSNVNVSEDLRLKKVEDVRAADLRGENSGRFLDFLEARGGIIVFSGINAG